MRTVIARLRRLGGVTVAALLLGGCEGNLLDPKGPIAAAEKSILIDASVIMLCIIVPAIVLTFGFAWWYRASNTRATYRPDWAYSGRLELLMWSVPLLTIIFLSGIAWVGSHELDPAMPIASDKKPIDVDVVALDWKWLFIYPEQKIATVNQLVVPAGTPVHFRLTSSGVWNSFFIPRLGSQIYTMKGMTTQLNLMADKPGQFFGLSTHFSGDGFSDMTFPARFLTADDFANWVQTAKAGGGDLDDAGYIQLEKQSSNDPAKTFAAVEPDLFDKVVSQRLPAGPGPAQGAGAAPREVTPKGGS